VSITGIVAKGLVDGVNVRVYKLNADGSRGEEVGTGATNDDGSYSLNLGENYEDGPVKVEVTHADGATMKCDVPAGCGNGVAFGGTYPLASDFSMSSVISRVDQNETVNVTTVTTVAAQVTQSRLSQNSSEETLSTGTKVAVINSEIADLFGISTTSGGDLTKVPVIDITDPQSTANASANALKYAALGPAIISAVQSDAGSGSVSIEQALSDFVASTSDGSIIGDAGDDSSITDLQEILEAAIVVVTAADELDPDTSIENLNELNTVLQADVNSLEGLNEEQTGTPDDTLFDEFEGDIAADFKRAKAATAQIRELGRTALMDALDGENNNAGAATAFETELESVEDLADTDYVMEATGLAVEAIAQAELSGDIEAVGKFDNNGSTGFVGGPISTFVSVSESELLVEFDETGNGAVDRSFQANKAFGYQSGIEGTWVGSSVNSDELLLLTFFSNGTYLHAEVNPNGAAGMEKGTYSRNASTGELTVATSFDNNGDIGLSGFAEDSQGEVSKKIKAFPSFNQLSLQIDENADDIVDETLGFKRVNEDMYGDSENGTWRTGISTTVFFGDGTYIHAVEPNDSGLQSGLEWGSYDRDKVREIVMDDADHEVVAVRTGNSYRVDQAITIEGDYNYDLGYPEMKVVQTDISATVTSTLEIDENLVTNTDSVTGSLDFALSGTAVSDDTSLTIIAPTGEAGVGSYAKGSIDFSVTEEDIDYNAFSGSYNAIDRDEAYDNSTASLTGLDIQLHASMTHSDSSGSTSFEGMIRAHLDSLSFNHSEEKVGQRNTDGSVDYTYDGNSTFSFGLLGFNLEGHVSHTSVSSAYTDEFNAVIGIEINGGNRSLEENCLGTETTSAGYEYGYGYDHQYTEECTDNFEDTLIDVNITAVLDTKLNGIADAAKVTLTGARDGLGDFDADANIKYPGVELDFDLDTTGLDTDLMEGTLVVRNMGGVKFEITGEIEEKVDGEDVETIHEGTVTVNDHEVGILVYNDNTDILTVYYHDGTFETIQ
jgi:hypothetical protein